MALRLPILAAVAVLFATSGWTPDPASPPPLDPEDVAVLLAAIAGTDTLRRRRR